MTTAMRYLAALLAALALPAGAADPQPAAAGSTAFCLFALPPDNATHRLINLGIVQYVDLRVDEVRIYFGGGNLGSGHEARIPVRSRDEADAVLARLRATATRCAQSTTGATP